MRPIDEGASPYDSISEYGDALPYLEKAIGGYCSYCEFPLSHVPEVEHVISKTHGGSLTAWDNLLLGCKYCNSRKKDTTTATNAKDYLWPDRFNTEIAFTYDGGKPQVNNAVLDKIDPSGDAAAKAQKLYDLVKLGNIPTPGEKDKRFCKRNEAYESAKTSLENWKIVKTTQDANTAMKKQILLTAKATGFFSIWVTVFAEESEILLALIDAFPGTNKKFFDVQTGKCKEML